MAAKRSREKRRLNDIVLETKVLELTNLNNVIAGSPGANGNATNDATGDFKSCITMIMDIKAMAANGTGYIFTGAR